MDTKDGTSPCDNTRVIAIATLRGNRVTLPKVVREALGVATGDYVRFDVSQDGVVIKKYVREDE